MRGGKGRNELPDPVLIGMHLSAAGQPERTKKLLLHAKEIRQIENALAAKGKVAVPLSVYIQRGWAKVTIGVGSGRKQYDKRSVLRKHDIAREQQRDLKSLKR